MTKYRAWGCAVIHVHQLAWRGHGVIVDASCHFYRRAGRNLAETSSEGPIWYPFRRRRNFGVLPHNPAEPFLLPDRNTPTAMLETPKLNELTQRLVNVVPADLRLIKGDLEKNIHAILQASFSRMNLVSREEFDVQRAVLARTREQLEALEQRVAELEQRILDR